MSKFGNKVKEITSKDFSSFKIKSTPKVPSIIVFYASWCGYCQMLVPEYNKLSNTSGIKVYSIEADVPGNKEIFQHFQVQGFPTIRYVNKLGEIDMETYYGDRDAKSMLKYIKEKGTKGGAKRKQVKKTQKGGCVGKRCNGHCKGGKCKKKVPACGKCKGKCKGGQCKRQRGGSIKTVKKVVKKVVKSVKKMVGGKRKPAKKTNKRRVKKTTTRKPKKTIKRRRK